MKRRFTALGVVLADLAARACIAAKRIGLYIQKAGMTLAGFTARYKDENKYVNAHRLIFSVIYLAFIIFGLLRFTVSFYGVAYFIISALALPWCFLNISRCYKFLNVFYSISIVVGGACLYEPAIAEAIRTSVVTVIYLFFFIIGGIIAIFIGVRFFTGGAPSDGGAKERERKARRAEELLWGERYEQRRREEEAKRLGFSD